MTSSCEPPSCPADPIRFIIPAMAENKGEKSWQARIGEAGRKLLCVV